MARAGEGFWKNEDAIFEAEWLETNGLGGYAASTLSGLQTRRYHGLLVAATTPPVGRTVLLSKLEETLVVGDQRFDLSVNRYPGTLHPRGDRFLTGFEIEPFPTWTYEAGGVRLVKTLFLVDGENTAVVTYRVAESPASIGKLRLEIRPLTAFRDYHALARENPGWDRTLGIEPGRVTLRPYPAVPALHVAHDAVELDTQSFWYRNFEYQRERERGFDFEEDLFSPFRLVFDLSGAASQSATLVASTERRLLADVPGLEAKELARREAVSGPSEGRAALRAIRRAADQFLVRRDAGFTVIAGYPWFTDWGRDTMIALPGLTLATGRADQHGVARSILATFASHLDRGMIPNRFLDKSTQTSAESEYNTVDATLWFVEAVRAYANATGDHAFVRGLFPSLLGIVDAHVQGTRYGIRLDHDGLLASGAEGVQLTWMDAKIGDWVVTPRRGKPVEIQALWFNALSYLAGLAGQMEDDSTRLRLEGLAERAQSSFERLFWNAQAGCLFDVLDENGKPDLAIRPNQIFAVSLPHPIQTGERALRVVAAVEQHLLTPYGLRTLAPSDPRYIGRYEGGPRERDAAYHQGTVWPWLLGPFIAAYLRVHGKSAETSMRAAAILRTLFEHLLGAGLGQLPEIFDGDAPHRPDGCFAQAWSIAQVTEAVTNLGLLDNGRPG